MLKLIEITIFILIAYIILITFKGTIYSLKFLCNVVIKEIHFLKRGENCINYIVDFKKKYL